MTLCRSQLHEVSDPAFCQDCAICKRCGDALSPAEYNWSLSNATKDQLAPEFFHYGCYSLMWKEKISTAKDFDERIIDILNLGRLGAMSTVSSDQLDKDGRRIAFAHLHEVPFHLVARQIKWITGYTSAAIQLLQQAKFEETQEIERERKRVVKDRDKSKIKQTEQQRKKDEEKRKLLCLTPEEADRYKKDQRLLKQYMSFPGFTKEMAIAKLEEAKLKAEQFKQNQREGI